MSSVAPVTEHGRVTLGRGVMGLALATLLVAMALSTTWWPASKPIPGERVKFDAAAWAADHWESTVLPGITEKAVDVSVLLPLIAQDPEAAGAQYGHHDGTSPYTYPVTVTGTAGRAENGLLPIEVPGLPQGTRVSVQIGPAINGTALRDATGEISFNDFVNQVDYANVATELNNITKTEVLAGLDPAALEGKQVTVVGAASPLNPQLMTITAVELQEGS